MKPKYPRPGLDMAAQRMIDDHVSYAVAEKRKTLGFVFEGVHEQRDVLRGIAQALYAAAREVANEADPMWDGREWPAWIGPAPAAEPPHTAVPTTWYGVHTAGADEVAAVVAAGGVFRQLVESEVAAANEPRAGQLSMSTVGPVLNWNAGVPVAPVLTDDREQVVVAKGFEDEHDEQTKEYGDEARPRFEMVEVCDVRGREASYWSAKHHAEVALRDALAIGAFQPEPAHYADRDWAKYAVVDNGPVPVPANGSNGAAHDFLDTAEVAK